jgi:hypothetical protein
VSTSALNFHSGEPDIAYKPINHERADFDTTRVNVVPDNSG